MKPLHEVASITSRSTHSSLALADPRSYSHQPRLQVRGFKKQDSLLCIIITEGARKILGYQLSGFDRGGRTFGSCYYDVGGWQGTTWTITKTWKPYLGSSYLGVVSYDHDVWF